MLSLNYYDLFFGVFKPGCAILKLFIQTIFVHATHVRSTCGVIKIRTLYECKGIIFSRFVGGFFWLDFVNMVSSRSVMQEMSESAKFQHFEIYCGYHVTNTWRWQNRCACFCALFFTVKSESKSLVTTEFCHHNIEYRII